MRAPQGSNLGSGGWLVPMPCAHASGRAVLQFWWHVSLPLGFGSYIIYSWARSTQCL